MLFNLGGTVRSEAAKNTLARLMPLLPLWGITRVASQEGLGDIKIPVSICYRPNSRLLSSSQGKGISRELADISAIMESVETFHAERLRAPDLVESIENVRKSGQTFIDPLILNRSSLQSVYHEDEPIGWIYVHRIKDNKLFLMPRSVLDLNAAFRREEISTMAIESSSNGLASGNTFEEAVIHGLYELIERHCVSKYSKLTREKKFERELSIKTIKNMPHLECLFKYIDEAGLDLTVKALHDTFGIPAFKAAVQERSSTQRTSGYGGFGSHPYPEVALSRAITEAIQSRVTMIASSRDDVFPQHYTLYNLSLAELMPPPMPINEGKINWKDIPSPPNFQSFQEILEWTMNILTKHGFNDVYFFNHQNVEYGNIPVVHVICPGLRFDKESRNARD